MPTKIPYKQVKINLNPDDYIYMKELADRYDTTIASLFRELAQLNQIENAKSRRGSVKHTNNVDPNLLYHLAKIGNNINQIARHCNASKSVDRLVLSELSEMREQLSSLLHTAHKSEGD